jgi:hypothetical protein
MISSRQLAACAYFVAFLLVAIPLVDVFLGLAPWNVAVAHWRFGAAGLVSNALMIPSLGMLIAVATAATQGHVSAQRGLRVASWVAVVAIVIGLVLFPLDALQTRSLVRQDAHLSFDVASAIAECKMALGAIAFALFARALRPPVGARARARTGSATLILAEATSTAAKG